ncbi:hypothetical protein A2755_00950 [Candidatus Wolfebacteria bacterium RIFCSPHIGHO2_01_FULL_48_22]|uniref:Bacterial type II secretion system protein E domain-containing protein n=2 Tax=Candidatus Wolfeibacteriota TaxID=1752735 RepID=A0A1F8DVW8_9BACT|nr:MAG: hypothetical protein A2755_00950 [Candidatus Wolfebacteria bacterium RIFCSPHIGHO2_01_FULL_48_22]OGM93580.1 MAG: hypothetical protein A2935_03065 [Candidatus Wolfebacteria bacterium RIFCSPLOWO2_01_FULL_47_17b]
MDNKVLITKLVEQQALEHNAAQKLLQEASYARRTVEDLIYERRLVGEDVLLKLKSEMLNVPFKKLTVEEIPPQLFKIVPEEMVRNYRVVPLSYTKELLVIGMVSPEDPRAQEALKFIARQLKVSLGIYLVSMSLWEAVMRKYSPYRSEVEAAVKSITSVSAQQKTPSAKVVQLEAGGGGSEDAPIIRIVATTLKEAVWEKASDVHIEPQRNSMRIRFRLDGELKEAAVLPAELHQPIVSRVKVLSNLKIDETRVPQDGRFRTVLMGRDIDFRVATFPTPVGEKVAIRVLDPIVGLRGLNDLGLRGRSERLIKQAIDDPYGMILITGPTGSGKTTTLYALMQILNTEQVNIVSLEDPVEYYMDGLNQSQVHPEIGYDFASGLRQILRQDPDVIMIGEIRDGETAGLAVHAALTGHIVLSTLHTNNALGVIPRLVDMKVEPFLLPASVNLMIGQRLVPRLCQKCRRKKEISAELMKQAEEELASVDPPELESRNVQKPYQFYESPGCDVCNGKGISGRMALYEALEMTRELEDLVAKNASESTIVAEAKRQKMVTMRQDGVLKAIEGLVSLEAVLRETESI